MNALYSAREKRSIALYIGGIMLYKFGLEQFNGAVITLATDRFQASNTFSKLAILTGLNAAMQCAGSILIAPLVQRFATRTILSAAVLAFALMTAVLLIVDGATGGKIRALTPDNRVTYGSWDPDAIFPIYVLSGIAYGMVELIRRVIPRDIVGPHGEKLRRMDALVHILYEVSGTAGAFTSTQLIIKLGNNYSFLITPILFFLASLVWFQIDTGRMPGSHFDEGSLQDVERRKSSGGVLRYLIAVGAGFRLFALSIWRGFTLVFFHRRYVWLFFSYSVALHCHRYLENGIAPIFARRILNDSAQSQTIVAFSNLGELLGALFVFVFALAVKTPLPWLRLDALLLMIVWVVPYFPVNLATHSSAYYAVRLGACFLPISLGWAAGDVSLTAYVQQSLTHSDTSGEDNEVSSLGSMMAFLYSSYIVIYTVTAKLLGDYIDRVVTRGDSVQDALVHVAGAHFTVLSGIILISTFVPRGAFAFNPQMVDILEQRLNSTDSLDDDQDNKEGADEGTDMATLAKT